MASSTKSNVIIAESLVKRRTRATLVSATKPPEKEGGGGGPLDSLDCFLLHRGSIIEVEKVLTCATDRWASP